MERRVQRPVFNLQHTLRTLLDDMGDGVAVGRSEEKGLQNQDVERALNQLAVEGRRSAFRHRVVGRQIPIDNLPVSTVPERTPGISKGASRTIVRVAAALLLAAAGACARTSNAHPCGPEEQDPSAECGVVSVFENQRVQEGRRIDIHFTVLRALSGASHDAVFVLAGGPGAPGSSMRGIADGWLAPIRDAADIVFIDQRGTGKSNALLCPTNAATNPASVFGHVIDPIAVEGCRRRLETHADLTQYTTDASAADMDSVRARLGYERISLYGVSYGTRLAQAYMRRFPDRVRVSVLDGVLPFGEVAVSYARSLQQSLDRAFSACRQNPNCQGAHPRLAEDFISLERRLTKEPARAIVTPLSGSAVSVRLSVGDFNYAVRGILYGARGWTELPDMVGRAVESRDVGEFAQRYLDRATRIDSQLALGLHLSVVCGEDLAFVTDAAANTAAAGTILGRYLVDEYRTACAEWPRSAVREDAQRPANARIPTILLSGYFDPVTPPEFAERVAGSLPINLLIVSPSTAHGSASACSGAIIGALRTGRLEGLPRSCQ
jgi:pimeloyl-ACP methyl ester carboxylesterase